MDDILQTISEIAIKGLQDDCLKSKQWYLERILALASRANSDVMEQFRLQYGWTPAEGINPLRQSIISVSPSLLRKNPESTSFRPISTAQLLWDEASETFDENETSDEGC